jgi:hypothetical protein
MAHRACGHAGLALARGAPAESGVGVLAPNQRFQRAVLALRARPAAEPRRWAAGPVHETEWSLTWREHG